MSLIYKDNKIASLPAQENAKVNYNEQSSATTIYAPKSSGTKDQPFVSDGSEIVGEEEPMFKIISGAALISITGGSTWDEYVNFWIPKNYSLVMVCYQTASSEYDLLTLNNGITLPIHGGDSETKVVISLGEYRLGNIGNRFASPMGVCVLTKMLEY